MSRSPPLLQSRLNRLVADYRADYVVQRQPFDPRQVNGELVFSNREFLVFQVQGGLHAKRLARAGDLQKSSFAHREEQGEMEAREAVKSYLASTRFASAPLSATR